MDVESLFLGGIGLLALSPFVWWIYSASRRRYLERSFRASVLRAVARLLGADQPGHAHVIGRHGDVPMYFQYLAISRLSFALSEPLNWIVLKTPLPAGRPLELALRVTYRPSSKYVDDLLPPGELADRCEIAGGPAEVMYQLLDADAQARLAALGQPHLDASSGVLTLLLPSWEHSFDTIKQAIELMASLASRVEPIFAELEQAARREMTGAPYREHFFDDDLFHASMADDALHARAKIASQTRWRAVAPLTVVLAYLLVQLLRAYLY